ncbi:MAG: 4Fe-4S dicluster domain-containing protein [Coriobacteriia bacterium]|nr:4Fe-4S dicluster domain-containing protein [Coriobacteriia bacterium]MCL2749633.1 4Fe-4S dicluster domain-containing protein [Coriobacteriia bacterium]
MSVESTALGLAAKLGLNVFKEGESFHIRINPGQEGNALLKKVISVCPSALYTINDNGEVNLCEDGCLECGTCRIALGIEVIDWQYPEGGTGVQYRFG